MTKNAIISIMQRKWRDILVSAIIFGMLAFFFAIATSARYRVQTDYLIVQNGINYRDLYSLSKSAEYAGNVLSDAVFSQLFIDEVDKTGSFDIATLPQDPKERLDAWGGMVHVRKNFQSNILTVSIVDDNQETTINAAKAIGQVLTQKNDIFRTGTPDSITLKVLSGPITEKNPSTTLLAIVTVLGVLIGAGFGIGLSFIQRMRIIKSELFVPIAM